MEHGCRFHRTDRSGVRVLAQDLFPTLKVTGLTPIMARHGLGLNRVAWCAYHYGQWIFTPEFGWVWVPGYEWTPGRVAWATGPGYIGWSPYLGGGNPNVNFWVVINRDRFGYSNYSRYVLRRDTSPQSVRSASCPVAFRSASENRSGAHHSSFHSCRACKCKTGRCGSTQHKISLAERTRDCGVETNFSCQQKVHSVSHN